MALYAALDTLTEAGSGFADLNTHTAEVGGTWALFYRSAGGLTWQINKDLDTADTATTAGTIAYSLGSLSLATLDLYATIRSTGEAGVLFRTTGSSTFYAVTRNPSLGRLVLYSYVAGVQAEVTHVSVSGLSGTVGVRAQVSGVSPTTIRARAWDSSLAESGTWDIDTTDNTSGNQVSAGGVGLLALPGSGTFARVEDFAVTQDPETFGVSLVRRNLV